MEEKILLGRNQKILEVLQATWKQHLTQIPQHSQSRLNFMTDTHHQIRYFVVKELVNRQKPIEPEFISEKLNIPLELVKSTLEELERKLFFLVQNEHGAVAWAYPATVEVTPHKMDFSSGERLYGA
jgi:hydroxymethylpyrimidine pyrophosphatase-like HAD family hydrolase